MKFTKIFCMMLAVTVLVLGGWTLMEHRAHAQEGGDAVAYTQNLMPITETEGDDIHLTQIIHSTYNPDGPYSSANCGPASFAMCLRALGYLGYGTNNRLSSEEQVHHGRALLYPNDYRVTNITRQGISYSQLAADSEYTNVGAYGPSAIQELGGESMTISSRTDLDKALDNGMPAVLFGYLDTEWRSQFSPAGHWSGTTSHYIAVLGKTYDGYYVVNDPMYYYGSDLMTYDQLSRFPSSGTGVSGTAFYWKTPTPYAITKDSTGISYVFMRKISNNLIYRTYQTSVNGGWSNWSSISSTTVRGNPVVIEQPNGRLLLFCRGTNKHVLMFSEDAYGSMSTVTDHGGETYYELEVCKNSDGRVEFYARGIDGTVYKQYQTTVNGNFSGWVSVDGDMRTGVSAVVNYDNRIELFAGGRDNGDTPLMHTWQSYPGGGWLGYWVDQEGHCRSIPTAFSDSNGLILVFVRGSDNRLYYKSQENWSYWGAAGTGALYTFGRPKVELFTYYVSGWGYCTDAQVFVRGYDNKTYRTRYEKRYNPSTWTAWNSNLGGTATCDPAAARCDNGRTYVVVQGTTGYLYYRLQSDDQGNWGDWQILGNAMDFR